MTTHHTPPVGRLLVRTICFLFPFIFCSITPANAFDKTVGTPGVLALSSAVALGSIIGVKCKARTAQRARKVLNRYKDLPLAQRKKLTKEAHAATGMKHLYGTTATLSSIMAVVSAYLWYKNAHEEAPTPSASATANSVATETAAVTTVTPDAPTPASNRTLCPTGRATPPPTLGTVSSSQEDTEAVPITAPAQRAEAATAPAPKAFKPPAPPARRRRRLSAAHCPPLAPLSRAESPGNEGVARPFIPHLNLAHVASGVNRNGFPQTARLGNSSSLSSLPEPPASARARLQKDQSLTHSTSAPTIQASQPSPQRRQRRSRPAPLHAPEDEYVGSDGEVHVRRPRGPQVNGWVRPDTPVGDSMIHPDDSHDGESLASAYSLPSTPRPVPTPRTQERAERIVCDGVAAVFKSDEFAERIALLTRQRAIARTEGDGRPSVRIVAPAPTALEELAGAPLTRRDEPIPERTMSRGGPAPFELPPFPRKAGERAQAILALITEQETEDGQQAVAAAVVAQESKKNYKNTRAATFYKDFIVDIERTYGVVSEPLPASFRPMDAMRYRRLPGRHLPEPGTEETGTIGDQRLDFEIPGYEPLAVEPAAAPAPAVAPSVTPRATAAPTSPVFTGIRNPDGTITYAAPSGGHYPDFAAIAEQQRQIYMQRYQEWVAAQAASFPPPSNATDAVAQEASRHGIGMGTTVVPDPSYRSPVASPPERPRRASRRRSHKPRAVGSQHERTTPYSQQPRRVLPRAGSRMTSKR